MARHIDPVEARRRLADELLGTAARACAHPVAEFYRAVRKEQDITQEEALQLTELYLRTLLRDITGVQGQ